jgi:hypothetical protein
MRNSSSSKLTWKHRYIGLLNSELKECNVTPISIQTTPQIHADLTKHC